jgi:hypothetical protein
VFNFTKFALLTSALNLVFAILIDIGFVLAVRIVGIIGIRYSRLSWLILWMPVWLVSFLLAWPVFVAKFIPRAHK